jgi:hypothetical protein
MHRRARLSSVGLALLVHGLLVHGASGCTQLVDPSRFTFDVDPCAPVEGDCTGGTSLTFLVVAADTPAVDAERRRDGFDLDGTSEAVCARPDLSSPTGQSGIDNEIAGMVELYESSTGVDLREEGRSANLRGEDLVVFFVDHYDGPNDDCVQVTQRRARVPAGTVLADLDGDGDGEIDPGLNFDFGSPTMRDPDACVLGGVAHARFGDVEVALLEGSTQARDVRLRMPISAVRIEGALIGGAVPLDDLLSVVPPALVEFIRPRADLGATAREANDCTAISFGLGFEMVPAERGTAF